eukprot:2074538-Pyramimonas_sp.AAC.1
MDLRLEPLEVLEGDDWANFNTRKVQRSHVSCLRRGLERLAVEAEEDGKHALRNLLLGPSSYGPQSTEGAAHDRAWTTH